MVALAVFALVATLAIPNFRNFVQNNQMTASANNLMSSLALARSEAIKRNTQVSICASSTQTGCTGTDWNNGWIVFVDGGNPGVVDGNDEILNAVQGLPGGMDLSSTDPYIQFKPNGSLAACQFCLLDLGRLQALALLEDLRNWAARALHTLLPGKDAVAMGGSGGHHNQHWAGDGHNHAGSGRGTGGTGGTGSGGTTGGGTGTGGSGSGSSGSGSSGGSGSGGTAGGSGGSGGAVAQTGVEMILCNNEQVNETGRRFFISITGHITVSGFGCN